MNCRNSQQFSLAEHADFIVIYEFCDRNNRSAIKEYQRRIPLTRVLNHQTFGSMLNYLKEHGKNPKPKEHQIVHKRTISFMQWKPILKVPDK